MGDVEVRGQQACDSQVVGQGRSQRRCSMIATCYLTIPSSDGKRLERTISLKHY